MSYRTAQEAQREISHFLMHRYNWIRPHQFNGRGSNGGYLPPPHRSVRAELPQAFLQLHQKLLSLPLRPETLRVAHNDHIATGEALAPLPWPKDACAALVCIQRHGPLDEKPVSLFVSSQRIWHRPGPCKKSRADR